MSLEGMYLGDCSDILPTLGEVDAIVTDPPYGINFAAQPTKWQRRAGMQPQEWDNESASIEPLLGLAPVIVIWGGNYFRLPISRGWLSWIKPDAPPSMGNVEMAWTNLNMNPKYIACSISSVNAERVGHPTQKPLKVMTWCIEMCTKPSDIILDPFMGSGTTGVACARLGRKFIGIERDPTYFAIAEKRIREARSQLIMELA